MMYVILKSVPNPDYDEFLIPAPELRISVDSVDDASRRCRDYIEKFNLGSGNWVGGDVFENETKIARISYNGRIWVDQEVNRTVYY